MENLNAEMIKKALEYCANNDECVGEACPYYATGCEKNMPKDALTLTKSQEQRINELTSDNERLHASCTELEQKCASVKADTVRKMQERLKDGHLTATNPNIICLYETELYQIANELLEGSDQT